MRHLLIATTLAGVGISASASPGWQFSERIAVVDRQAEKVYHHLDAAGRRSIAVSGQRIAVVWEDNSSGKPTAYLAIKPAHDATFLAPVVVSTGAPAYAPSVASLAGGDFIVGWEEGEVAWARVVTGTGLGAPARLDDGEAAQVSFAMASNRLIAAAWAKREPHGKRRVYSAWLTRQGDQLTVDAPIPVSRTDTRAPQLYPVVSAVRGGATVLWEDRRRGHTTILAAHRSSDGTFGNAVLVNEPAQKSDRYGSGSGVTRPTTAISEDKLVAAWMDKRGFRKGYGVYAAASPDAGRGWTPNERVQDDFGEQNSQWHPTIAANIRGRVVALWDDDRDGTSDICLSMRTREGWSANETARPAATRAIETNPAAALADDGTLHMVWISQEAENGPTRLWYASGIFQR